MTRYPSGETWIFDIGIALIEHRLQEDLLHYHILTGPKAGERDAVALEVVRIRDHVFLVSWQERDGSTVVHVEDFADGTFHSCLTQPGAALLRFKGTMRRA